MKRRNNPHLKADKGVIHRTGRDDRLEYTAHRTPHTVPPEPVGTRTVRGWRFTPSAYRTVRDHPSVHLCDVFDALNHAATVRPGRRPGVTIREHGLLRVEVEHRRVLAIHTR